jgi:hypothetical protein
LDTFVGYLGSCTRFEGKLWIVTFTSTVLHERFGAPCSSGFFTSAAHYTLRCWRLQTKVCSNHFDLMTCILIGPANESYVVAEKAF